MAVQEELSLDRSREALGIRLALAIRLALYGMANDTDEIPRDFFRSEAEVAIAESLTEAETMYAAAVVLEVFAERTQEPRIREAAYQVSDVLRGRLHAYAHRADSPRLRDCRPRARQPRSHRVRARAGASRDGPSSDDPSLPEPDRLARLRRAVCGWSRVNGARLTGLQAYQDPLANLLDGAERSLSSREFVAVRFPDTKGGAHDAA